MKIDKDKQREKDLAGLFTRVENTNIDFIQNFDRALDKKLCKKLINKFEEMSKKGDTYQGCLGSDRRVDLLKKNSMDIDLATEYDEELTELYDEIGQIILKCVYSYFINVGFFGIGFAGLKLHNIKKYVQEESIPKFPDSIALSAIRLRKYDRNTGGYFVPHFDSQGDLHRRVVAVIIYLNDVKYGGETIFPILKTSIKPRIGRLSVFPSQFTHMHYGNTSPQNKYIIVGHIEELSDYLNVDLMREQFKKEKERKNG